MFIKILMVVLVDFIIVSAHSIGKLGDEKVSSTGWDGNNVIIKVILKWNETEASSGNGRPSWESEPSSLISLLHETIKKIERSGTSYPEIIKPLYPNEIMIRVEVDPKVKLKEHKWQIVKSGRKNNDLRQRADKVLYHEKHDDTIYLNKLKCKTKKKKKKKRRRRKRVKYHINHNAEKFVQGLVEIFKKNSTTNYLKKKLNEKFFEHMNKSTNGLLDKKIDEMIDKFKTGMIGPDDIMKLVGNLNLKNTRKTVDVFELLNTAMEYSPFGLMTKFVDVIVGAFSSDPNNDGTFKRRNQKKHQTPLGQFNRTLTRD